MQLVKFDRTNLNNGRSKCFAYFLSETVRSSKIFVVNVFVANLLEIILLNVFFIESHSFPSSSQNFTGLVVITVDLNIF